ncbi:MAG: enoyl-CoA hydratase/isomerase family protein [Candidatus Andeanibacterium colombiense]|uniref:3-hydroxyisobutyryl-CoA hydrolase n=1 Tax=Candidatus Andeanibacterium colombiense TaxID=3121345 RepID=A0AAJ5X8I5_9SPHN|nr:MAG: enoyl-CoA hydratase/isomerase family protein [Sphingomonadaceae bacterium]
MSALVHSHRHGRTGHLSLARPRALNALNHDMIAELTRALLEWRDDPTIEVVLLDHAEGRGFCAGGDVAAVRRSVLEDGGKAGRAFFMAEYRLNHLLFTYPKPVAAFMDGITMGGGVGLALPARYRVATENTVFAMPEAAIGLFPDVGAGWYLSRLPGRLGPFLALTGARLDGAECLWAGLATHYLPSEVLPEAKARIAREPALLSAILDQLSAKPPEPRIAGTLGEIDRLFAADRIDDILAALANDASDWAAQQSAVLRSKSPLTLKVALRQIAGARDIADFAEEMRIEYRLASRVIEEPNFAEGVRAVLVDKDNSPRWNPAAPEGISETKIDALFAPLPEAEEWTPL